jgi:hypothetical protein
MMNNIGRNVQFNFLELITILEMFLPKQYYDTGGGGRRRKVN